MNCKNTLFFSPSKKNIVARHSKAYYEHFTLSLPYLSAPPLLPFQVICHFTATYAFSFYLFLISSLFYFAGKNQMINNVLTKQKEKSKENASAVIRRLVTRTEQGLTHNGVSPCSFFNYRLLAVRGGHTLNFTPMASLTLII